MVTQLAREAGAYVIGTGRAVDRQKAALDWRNGCQEALQNGEGLEDSDAIKAAVNRTSDPSLIVPATEDTSACRRLRGA